MSTTTTLPPRTHPVLAALQVIEDGLDDFGDANLWSMTDEQTLTARVQLGRIVNRVTAATLQTTREIDARGAAGAVGAPTTRAWLVNRCRIHPGDAHRETALAAALDTALPATAAALAAGDLTRAAAEVIADTDRHLAGVATAA